MTRSKPPWITASRSKADREDRHRPPLLSHRSLATEIARALAQQFPQIVRQRSRCASRMRRSPAFSTMSRFPSSIMPNAETVAISGSAAISATPSPIWPRRQSAGRELSVTTTAILHRTARRTSQMSRPAVSALSDPPWGKPIRTGSSTARRKSHLARTCRAPSSLSGDRAVDETHPHRTLGPRTIDLDVLAYGDSSWRARGTDLAASAHDRARLRCSNARGSRAGSRHRRAPDLRLAREVDAAGIEVADARSGLVATGLKVTPSAAY